MITQTLKSKCGFKLAKVPTTFTLNSGHVYFFYNKGLYLQKRYEIIRNEMTKRGFNATLPFIRDVWPNELFNDWAPSVTDENIVRERIQLRISQKPNWYYGKLYK